MLIFQSFIHQGTILLMNYENIYFRLILNTTQIVKANINNY